MTTFLTINGFPIAVADQGASDDEEIIGEESRALDGSLRHVGRGVKRVWNLRSVLDTYANSETVKKLLRPQSNGFHFPFNTDLYSSKGTNYSGAGGSIGAAAPSPKFGAGRAAITSGNTLTFSTALTGSWTLGVWKWDGSSWDHWIKTSAGTQWKNGVLDVTATTWFGVSSNSAFLTGDGATRYYDDLVCLPFLVLSTWPALWYARSVAFSSLPKLLLGGGIIDGGTEVEVMGRIGTTTKRQAVISGSWVQNAQEFDFTLSEV